MSETYDRHRLQHMLNAAQKAIRFTKGKQREDLDADEMLALALVRLLEIIGEAASKVSEETRNTEPSLPWAKMVGMRNRLIHGYDIVDLNVLWQTIGDDLNPLVESLAALLSKMDDS